MTTLLIGCEWFNEVREHEVRLWGMRCLYEVRKIYGKKWWFLAVHNHSWIGVHVYAYIIPFPGMHFPALQQKTPANQKGGKKRAWQLARWMAAGAPQFTQYWSDQLEIGRDHRRNRLLQGAIDCTNQFLHPANHITRYFHTHTVIAPLLLSSRLQQTPFPSHTLFFFLSLSHTILLTHNSHPFPDTHLPSYTIQHKSLPP